MYSIYGLVDPRDQLPFYVGLTGDVYKRFLDHIKCKGGNLGKTARIMSLREADIMVHMPIYEQTEDVGYARIREAYWIHHFEVLGAPLTNMKRLCYELKARILVRGSGATVHQLEVSNQEAVIQAVLGPGYASDLGRAIEHWRAGASSVRKLQAAMGISTYYAAYQLAQCVREELSRQAAINQLDELKG
jgi:hypothetical protein